MELRMVLSTRLQKAAILYCTSGVRASSHGPRRSPLPPLKSPIKTTSVSVGGKKRRASSGYRMVTSSPFCRISASSSIKRVNSHSSRTARIDLPLFEIRETKRVGRSYCYCCAALDMAQVQRERNLREMNSPSTCGPRRAATIAESSEEVARCGYRYVSSIGTARSLDRSCISRDSLVVATQSQRGGRSFLPPLLSDRPGQPPPNSASISASPGITCTRRKTHARVQNNEFRSQRLIGRIVALAGLSLSVLPACPRLLERHQSPTTQATHHTDEPRSSLVLPLPSLSFTSRTPLLVIPPPTPCFELNRK
jgi:hypothetical protein